MQKQNSAHLAATTPTAAALLATYPDGLHPDLAAHLAANGLTAAQIVTRYSDVYVMCPSYALAATVKAGKWGAMSDICKTNPEHPDAKAYPWLVDIPFAFLAGYISAKQAKRA